MLDKVLVGFNFLVGALRCIVQLKIHTCDRKKAKKKGGGEGGRGGCEDVVITTNGLQLPSDETHLCCRVHLFFELIQHLIRSTLLEHHRASARESKPSVDERA